MNSFRNKVLSPFLNITATLKADEASIGNKTDGLQRQNDPSHPFQHMKTFKASFCDCTISTDLTALVSTRALSWNLCKPSSWSERKWKQPLCPFTQFLLGLNPQEMDTAFSDQDVGSCWTESQWGPKQAGLGLDVTDVSIHYGWHSTYGTTNRQLVWWMTLVSRQRKERYTAYVCVCMSLDGYEWPQSSHLIDAQQKCRLCKPS